MKKSLLLMLLLCPIVHVSAQSTEDTEAIDRVLDAFHGAAAVGDWPGYFALMSDDGVFLGTDATERWTRAEFQDYASASDGWVYHPRTRHINLSPDGASAWFDEILDSASYGVSRGSGVLIRTAAGWKIAQYHLTFPIPNDLAQEITDRIKAWTND